MPRELCERKMSTGTCTMDKGHRGRCTTSSFVCDCCNKSRRGAPAERVINPWDRVVEAEVCWFCANVDPTTKGRH
jgi:hypothetical protein